MKLIRDRYYINYQGRKINKYSYPTVKPESYSNAKPKKIPTNGEIVSVTSSEKITFLYVNLKTYE